MPILFVIILIVGAFFVGTANNPTVSQFQQTIPSPTQVETVTSSPSFTPSPTLFRTPKHADETYKQQLMSDLMRRIAVRYGEIKNSALQANIWDKQFLQCISDAEKSCLRYSQPIDIKAQDNQFVAPGQNPVGTPLSDTHIDGLPDVAPGAIYYSPQQQRQLCNQAKSVCSVYSNNFKAQFDSIASADKDITDWKKQLVEITKDCSVCISDYQAAMKKFDEFEKDIRQSIK